MVLCVWFGVCGCMCCVCIVVCVVCVVLCGCVFVGVRCIDVVWFELMRCVVCVCGLRWCYV